MAQQTTNGADSGVMADAQERLKASANQVAERLPEALAGAQEAAHDAQVALDGMSDEALIAGTGFSLGLAVGLFFGGVNRLLILLAAIPGAAMAATLSGRRQGGASAARRRAERAATGEG
ncbi:MAG TPA: hypothetical protein VM305_10455 [Candidatus Limnocylindrales bacterium]|nr:hypothetical protein [Candidatus Limnocylindrales bacterium]